MYKRLIFVLILLILCISLGVGSFITIEKISKNLTDDLESFIRYSQLNYREKAIDSIDSCIEKLDSYEKIYAVFLDHNLFECIMISIPSIKQLYVTGNQDEATEKCFESIETIKIIVNEQKLSLENIF